MLSRRRCLTASAAGLGGVSTLFAFGQMVVIDREVRPPAAPPKRFELLRTHVVQHEGFAFVRPLIGFETFAEGELIATDGPIEIRALCDGCTIFMPARKAIVGREGVYLTRPLD